MEGYLLILWYLIGAGMSTIILGGLFIHHVAGGLKVSKEDWVILGCGILFSWFSILVILSWLIYEIWQSGTSYIHKLIDK